MGDICRRRLDVLVLDFVVVKAVLVVFVQLTGSQIEPAATSC